jgi:class 3 adenylate cyclase
VDWDKLATSRQNLTTLVVDVRSSSRFFHDLSELDRHGDLLLFLTELSSATHRVLESITGGSYPECRVDKFTGDGFLIFFDEPEDGAAIKIGPARAVVAARLLRARVQAMIERLSRDDPALKPDLDKMGIVSGVVHGEVLYGPVAWPATRAPTGVLDSVVRAFRFSQVRKHRDIDDPDCILVCDRTWSAVEAFIANEQTDDGSDPMSSLAGVQTRKVRLGKVSGVRQDPCLQVFWSHDSASPDQV